MRIIDLTQGLGPQKCMFNSDYNDLIGGDNYSDGKRAGYEEAMREYEQKLKDKEQELIARGFIEQQNPLNPLTDYVPVSVQGLSGAVTSKIVPKSEAPQYVGRINEVDYNQELKINIGDIPHQNNLPKSSKLCGYVEIDGTYHKCNSCEHETIIRKIIWNNEDLRERYFNTPASFFDNMPRGMLQEEYFAMKDLGFVKISSFKNTPNDMVVFFYNTLTYKQSDIIYPR